MLTYAVDIMMNVQTADKPVPEPVITKSTDAFISQLISKCYLGSGMLWLNFDLKYKRFNV